jgi:hypothetical protein
LGRDWLSRFRIAQRLPLDEVGNVPLSVAYRRVSLASRSAYATTVRVGACLGSSFFPSLKERQLLKRNDPHNTRTHFAAPDRETAKAETATSENTIGNRLSIIFRALSHNVHAFIGLKMSGYYSDIMRKALERSDGGLRICHT